MTSSKPHLINESYWNFIPRFLHWKS